MLGLQRLKFTENIIVVSRTGCRGIVGECGIKDKTIGSSTTLSVNCIIKKKNMISHPPPKDIKSASHNAKYLFLPVHR